MKGIHAKCFASFFIQRMFSEHIESKVVAEVKSVIRANLLSDLP